MNTRIYGFNPDAAKQSDNVSSRITETGKYTGKFTRAEIITSKKGTEGVEFSFTSNAGQSADFLSLWTYNADGKELMGLKALNAIMACMRVSKLVAKEGLVEKWEGGNKVSVKADIFPDLINKPIGLLLQKEFYEKSDGSVGEKMNLYFSFDAASEMTAGEIIEKAAKPEKLAKVVATLRDRPMAKTKSAATGGTAPYDAAPPPNFDDAEFSF